MPRRFTLGTVEVLFRARTDRFRTAMRVAETSITRNERALLRFQTRMISFNSVSRLVSENIGTLSIIAGGLAVRSFARFDQSMATVRGTAQTTTRQFRILRNQAADLGRTTRFTAVQAAEGQLFLARAGFKVDEIFQALPGTLRLAQATQIEIGRSADIVTNIMSVFGVEVSDTARFVDVLSKATSSSNTNIEQLSEGMKFVGPIARLLNISLEETASFIGILGDNGIQASLAGAGLRRSFLRLVKPTKEVRDTIRDVGLTLEDVDIISHGATEVMQRFADANLTAEQAARIFGVRGVGIAAILQNNVENIKQLNQQLLNSAGFSNNLARIMDDTLSGAALRALSATQGLVIAFLDADNRAVSISDALDSVSRSINRITDNIQTFGPVISNAIKFLILFRLASTGAAKGLVTTVTAFAALSAISRSVGASTVSLLGFTRATGGAAALSLSFGNISRLNAKQMKALSVQTGLSSAALVGYRRNLTAVRGALLALGRAAVIGAVIEAFIVLGTAISRTRGQLERAQALIDTINDEPPQGRNQFDEARLAIQDLADDIANPSIGQRILDFILITQRFRRLDVGRSQLQESQEALTRDFGGGPVAFAPDLGVSSRPIVRPRPPIDPLTGLNDAEIAEKAAIANQKFINQLIIESTRLKEGQFEARRKTVELSDLTDRYKQIRIALINSVEAIQLEIDAQSEATKIAEEQIQVSENRKIAIQEILSSLQQEALAYKLTNKEIEINNLIQQRATDADIAAASVIIDYISAQEARIKAEKLTAKALEGRQREVARFAQQLSDVSARFFADAILGSESFSQSIRNLGQELLKLTIRFALLEPLASFFSGGLSSAFGLPRIGAAQTGGLAFGPTIVGEAGAELINVTNPSRVTPNNQLGSLRARPEVNIKIIVNGGDESGTRRALAAAIPAIRQEAVAAVMDAYGSSGELLAISRNF